MDTHTTPDHDDHEATQLDAALLMRRLWRESHGAQPVCEVVESVADADAEEAVIGSFEESFCGYMGKHPR